MKLKDDFDYIMFMGYSGILMTLGLTFGLIDKIKVVDGVSQAYWILIIQILMLILFFYMMLSREKK